MSTHADKGSPLPSANWLALQKVINDKKRKNSAKPDVNKKRHKLKEGERTCSLSAPTASASIEAVPSTSKPTGSTKASGLKNVLRQMVLGQIEFSEAKKGLSQPHLNSYHRAEEYIAVDCEMVGVGINGKESSLARVSLVNFYGTVLLDEYVRQKENVTDYRTRWSGIRPRDLVKADSFERVQRKVADLVKDKIIIGHALQHDFKALLLSHSRRMTRDTQICAYKAKVCKSNRVALRVLVKQELDVTIQSGEHSSVTDARAAMAIYRLHQKKFENVSKGFTSKASKKAGKSDQGKGMSSGLSTVTQTAGVKTVHGKGKKADPSARGSQRDKLEDYDFWTSDDDWRGPSWMREVGLLSPWDEL